jgi:hypothetical protein
VKNNISHGSRLLISTQYLDEASFEYSIFIDMKSVSPKAAILLMIHSPRRNGEFANDRE